MKDSKITFTDGRPDYQFSSSTPLNLILNTAKERNWPIDTIQTPDYVLSVFTHEAYEKVISDSTFTNVGV